MVRPLIGVTGQALARVTARFVGAKGMSGLTVDLHFTDYVHSIALAGGLAG